MPPSWSGADQQWYAGPLAGGGPLELRGQGGDLAGGPDVGGEVDHAADVIVAHQGRSTVRPGVARHAGTRSWPTFSGRLIDATMAATFGGRGAFGRRGAARGRLGRGGVALLALAGQGPQPMTAPGEGHHQGRHQGGDPGSPSTAESHRPRRYR